jgi:hypothetical protein
LTDPNYLATSLTFGVTYEFKVESRNSYSYSPFSETITLLCAFKPDPPTTITTTNQLDYVVIDWNEPINNGIEITGYNLYIQESDGVTYTLENTPAECDTTSSQVIANR